MSTLPRVRRVCALLAAGCIALGAAPQVAAVVPTPTEVFTPGVYIVSLEAPPRPDTAAGRAGMRRAQDRVLDALGGPSVLYRYTHALNGFAVELTRPQLKQLRTDRRVALVERSTVHHLDSSTSADFVGAEQAWRSTGGPEGAGRGTVVGLVDSGIWPENPSFAALPDALGDRDRFRGACVTGDQWERSDCNSKLVGARYFVKAFGEENLAASEYLSPRDGSGHGTHVAALAAGNDQVRVRVEGQDFGMTSGMAPGARIASYKACWTAPNPADDGCNTADTVAAIDQAVSDGVDVLGYAASGPAGVDSEAVETAFLNATAAGVFVAASAGNNGPRPGTVAHTSPWVTTVGASTYHAFQGSLVLGDGSSYVGAMVSDDRVPRADLVLGEDAAAPGSSDAEARLCAPGALDAAVVEGAIVVCDRGTVPRVEKSAAVARAGGVAMVLANVRPDAVYSDFHAVPTVHLDVADATEVKRYLAEADRPTAAIDPSASDHVSVPQVAPFSSRGPVLRDGGSLLKPDLTAPGVDVLSAVAPVSDSGRLWDLRSGTSMSTAQVVGLAAMLRGERPGWTPAMVKSALSTTAGELDGLNGPLAAGAGQVEAPASLDPGLVLDVPARQFRAWLDGRFPTRNLNLPSIAVGDLTGRARVARRVTNVSSGTETYSARTLGLDGLDVRVRPQTLQLAPGESGRFTVTLARTTAQLETPVGGYLVWTGLSHQARIPVVVIPRTVSAPEEATASGTRGRLAFQAAAGTSGLLDLSVAGLAAAQPVGFTLEPGAFDPQAPAADADTATFPIDVPSGSEVLRVSLEGRDSDDLDLHLYRGDDLVGAATGSGSDETLTVVTPEPGSYRLFVSSAVAGNGSTTTAQLYTWVLRPDDAGNLSVPDAVAVRAGDPFDVELSWDGLDATARWFGAIRYGSSDERTFVTLN